MGRLTLAGLAGLAMSHVVKHILHGAAVGQVAVAHFSVGLLPPLALVRMEQEDQLLLDELPLLGVCSRGSCTGACPYSVEPDLGASRTGWSADRHPSDDPRLLLRGLGTQGAFTMGAHIPLSTNMHSEDAHGLFPNSPANGTKP